MRRRRTDGTVSPLSSFAVRFPIIYVTTFVALILGVGLVFAWWPMLPIMFAIPVVLNAWLMYKEPPGCPHCTKRVRYGASICRWCHNSLTWQWKRGTPAEDVLNQ